MNIALTYGIESFELAIPDGFLAGPLICPRSPERVMSVDEAIEEAFADPIDSPPLREIVGGKRVGIVMSAEFRAGQHEHIIRHLLREIAAGEPREVLVFVATGTHDPEFYAANVRGWIAAAAEQAAAGMQAGIDVTTVVNDCDAADEHEYIDTTDGGTPVHIHRLLLSTDVRVYGHEAKHHYMNGYSCFDKQIAPGVAARVTTEHSHKKALDHRHSVAGRSPWQADAEAQFNPFGIESRDARWASERHFYDLDAGELEQRDVTTFGLDMISSKEGVLWARAGNPDAVCRAMVKEADALAAFEAERTRYVVISPGGPPACNAVYGVQNCFDMALKGAIQNGGEALILAPCLGKEGLPDDVNGLAPDGKSKALFWDNLVRFADSPLEEAARFIDEHFELYLWKTDRVLKLMKENGVRLHLFSELAPEKVAPSGIIPVADPQAWIDERAARGDGKIRAIDKGNTLLVRGVA